MLLFTGKLLSRFDERDNIVPSLGLHSVNFVLKEYTVDSEILQGHIFFFFFSFYIRAEI